MGLRYYETKLELFEYRFIAKTLWVKRVAVIRASQLRPLWCLVVIGVARKFGTMVPCNTDHADVFAQLLCVLVF
jgi:hypothetical protein|eukprot:COSAG06_NODE_5121_length_3705_cov_5.169994_4_plen_74_part_00